jgi:hypothetical protein
MINNLTKIFLVLFGIFLGVISLEITIRFLYKNSNVAIFDYGRYQLSIYPEILYETAPYAKIGFDYANEFGFRGTNSGIKKKDSIFRVAILGDSVTEGLLVDDYQNTYVKQLEDRLNNVRPTEILNFGVNGYNIAQNIATLEHKAIKFNPDLIILQYSLNDHRQDDGLISDSLIKQKKSEYIKN